MCMRKIVKTGFKGFQRYTSAVSCTLPQRMATQFTGNDKANLLSTALEADSGDNIAITSTSDAVVQGLDGKDTIVLDKNVSFDKRTLPQISALIQDRVVLTADIWEEIKVFFEAPGAYDEKSVKKVWKENTSDVMLSVCGVFEGGALLEADDIKRALVGIAEEYKIGLGGLMAPLRLCLVGSLKGPDLMMLIKLIGTSTAAVRIRHALASL